MSISFKEAMQIIQCPDCVKTFPKMEFLNIHMKQEHNESDDSRITRLTQMFETAMSNAKNNGVIKYDMVSKSFDCGECGLLFSTIQDQMEYNNEQHSNKSVNKYEQINDSEKDIPKPEVSLSGEYEIKIYPENKETEEDVMLNNLFGVKKKEKNQEGITMKGKSIAFKDACIVIKSKLSKGIVLKDEEGRQIKYSMRRQMVPLMLKYKH